MRDVIKRISTKEDSRKLRRGFVEQLKDAKTPSPKRVTKEKTTYYGKNLKQYQNRKFKEKFIEIETSGRTLQDETGEESIEVIKGNKKLEIIYIMQP